MEHRLRLGILGSTKGTDMQAIIDAIESNILHADIKIVISNKKDGYILERAKKHNIKTFHVDYTKHSTREDAEKELVAKLKEEDVQLVLLIGWMRILTTYIVNEYAGRIWNIHPSLLPKYSGGMNLGTFDICVKFYTR